MKKGNKKKQVLSEKDAGETCVGKKLQEVVIESVRKGSITNGIHAVLKEI